MAKTFTSKSLSFPKGASYRQSLASVGAARRGNTGSKKGSNSAVGGARRDIECPLAFALQDIECFGVEGLLNLETRNPTFLNSISDTDTEQKSLWTTLGFQDVEASVTNIVEISKINGKLYSGGYMLAKVNYVSPCDINGLSLNIPIPNAVPICFFGSLKDEAGVLQTGAANGKLMALYRREAPASSQGFMFVPRGVEDSAPKQETAGLFCWVLFGLTGSVGGSVTTSTASDAYGSGAGMVGGGGATVPGSGSGLCAGGSMMLEDVHATKPVWKEANPNFLSHPKMEELEAAYGPVATWNTSGWTNLGFVFWALTSVMLSNPSLALPVEYKTLSDSDGDGDNDIADLVAWTVFLHMMISGTVKSVDINNFPSIVPTDCCDDTDIPLTPDREKVEECIAELEIIDVKCIDNASTALAGGKTQSHAAGGDYVGSHVVPTVVPPSKNGDDCDEDDGSSNARNMYVLVGIRNTSSVSGFQFDVGFNKLSAAPASNCSAQLTHVDLINKDWNIVSRAVDDRFGYDKVIRVVSWQPLIDFSKAKDNKGFDIQDEDFLTGLQTVASLERSLELQHLTVVKVENVPPTSCACPEKEYYIAGDVNILKYKSPDQVKNPELYEIGAKWQGPVVLSEGRWWTASPSTGPLVRDDSSLPLRVVWEGIELINKRVVSNENTHAPQHPKFSLKYSGIFAGLLAKVPETFDNFIEYFTSMEGLNPWVVKALKNGLNLPYPIECSKYEFLWENLFNKQVDFIEHVAGSSLNEAQKTQLLNEFDKGFADDANLDGKFDVADLVALFNSAQIRCLFPDPSGVSDSTSTTENDWKKPPQGGTFQLAGAKAAFNNPVDAYARKGRAGSSKGGGYGGAKSYNTSYDADTAGLITKMSQLPNLNKVVPRYCLNTICTSTMSDLCPDVCGSTMSDTKQTILSTKTALALTDFSQRVDIMPDLGATAKFVFSAKPSENTRMAFTDTKGVLEQVRFTSASNTGTTLPDNAYAIKIQSTLDATIAEIKAYFDSHTSLSISCATLPVGAGSGRNGFLLTQGQVGTKGNTLIKISDTSKLITYQAQFAYGSSYLTNLPVSFRDWAEYFKSQHNIEYKELYLNEEEYGSSGATFFEIQTRVSAPVSNLANHFRFVDWVTSTVNFCGAYNSNTVVRFKALPGDGFNNIDVYDAESGALLSPSVTYPYLNFYTVPQHGKVTIISHNFINDNGVYTEKTKTLDNSKHLTPLTKDGGKVVSAKLFVTPMPDWRSGKYIELLDGQNKTLGYPNGSINISNTPMYGNSVPLTTSERRLLIGPKTSTFSQYYHDDSSSLHTYADYMLHAKLMGPNHIRVKYNTMKPFKYASFVVKTHNKSEIEKVALVYDYTKPYGDYKGWKVNHTFHENVADIPGLPLDPDLYSADGYSVVNVYITGSYTDESGNLKSGVANPEYFETNGDLCDIFFKDSIYDVLPIPIKTYICPPIGVNNQRFPDVKLLDPIDSTYVGIERKYPEGSADDTKFKEDTGQRPLLANFDSEIAEANTISTSVSGGNTVVDRWQAVPGTFVSPHNADNNHRPVFDVQTNDTRKSLHFTGGKGLSSPTTGSGFRTDTITKWSMFALVDLTETLNSSSLSSGNLIYITSLGGTSSGQMKLELYLEKGSSTGEFTLVGKSSGDDVGGTLRAHAVGYNFTVQGGASDLHGWSIISWIGDSETGRSSLYINGVSKATISGLLHNPAMSPHGNVWYIGHSGDSTSINSTVGHANGDSLGGRLFQILLYNEAMDSVNQQKVEAYLAVKYQNEGTNRLQKKLQEDHIAGESDSGVSGYDDEQKLDSDSYMKLNKTDEEARRRKEAADKKRKAADAGKSVLDIHSDRCAAAWVSDHVCLDKSSQTLLNVSCEGTNDEFFLGD